MNSIKNLISLPFRGQGVLFLLIFSFSLSAQNYPSGKSILDKVDRNMSSKTRVITSKMEIQGGRSVRTFESKSWIEGEEKAYTEYLSPAREKGTKMLKLENQLWIFSPSTDRVMQISGHMLRQSVMGSDMSYEDMMSDSPLLERYKAEVTAEEIIADRKCWVVTLTAIKENVNYHSQKIWVDQERFVPLKMDLFAKSGKLLKRTTLSNVQKIQERWFPMEMIYKDMLKEGKGTKMTVLSIQFDGTIPSGVFNKSNLK
ncbi:MAG: outer membrane lipoprotein-sorting protein [Bacteroidia bacterium]|nr:outer membrane lipoprotein-sorting protein [Bacteroidia bacterium]